MALRQFQPRPLFPHHLAGFGDGEQFKKPGLGGSLFNAGRIQPDNRQFVDRCFRRSW